MRSPRQPPLQGELNGHLYRDGKLVQVRCYDHGGGTFEVSPGAREYRDWQSNWCIVQ